MHEFQVQPHAEEAVWTGKDTQATNLALNTFNVVLLKHTWLGKQFISLLLPFILLN